MRTVKKTRRKTEGQVVEQATKNLLCALKKDMLAKEGRIDHDKLRKDGYSERLLARLDET